MCHLSHVTFLSLKIIGQSGGASRMNVCYQHGLPRLVLDIKQDECARKDRKYQF